MPCRLRSKRPNLVNCINLERYQLLSYHWAKWTLERIGEVRFTLHYFVFSYSLQFVAVESRLHFASISYIYFHLSVIDDCWEKIKFLVWYWYWYWYYQLWYWYLYRYQFLLNISDTIRIVCYSQVWIVLAPQAIPAVVDSVVNGTASGFPALNKTGKADFLPGRSEEKRLTGSLFLSQNFPPNYAVF